ncbi:histidine kinase [Leucobacter weissii]|uniref:Sensor-like histidine kinase SenX3 n=1 Tax=Leucobacter weissii TaxID=1983706 RepID=A0A939MJT8_9MICO|nr:ATP-binding protein [Leucobacter weissii]MBO1902279.1 histidine kinase [Leucobacter weissii]
MTQTALVLSSVGLGVIAGVLGAWAVFAARAAGRRRTEALHPELPEVAVELMNELDGFAVILDAALTPVYANPAARENPRISGEELRDEEFLTRARRVLSTGFPDTRMPDPETPERTVRVRIVRLQKKFLAVFADDLGEEQRVNAMRRDFIANVSHELKTPIAAIGLLSEAVLEAAGEPEIVSGFAKKLKKESRRLGELSRDIIQLSEAQSTLQPESREPIHLRAVLRTEVEAHRDFASQNGVELVLTESRDEDDAKAMTLGRPALIGTVIANLLSNAIRHSSEGGRVGIGIEVAQRNCMITVSDQGEGIAPEHLPRIFERFYRVDPSRSRDIGGTGLGLSIARHTMWAHGGDIDVWSQPGVGSTFTLTFPLYEERSGVKDAKPKKRLKKRSSAPTR